MNYSTIRIITFKGLESNPILNEQTEIKSIPIPSYSQQQWLFRLQLTLLENKKLHLSE